ncbi:GNAT family N-acetyltransferase [Anaerocolumna xylanovorans]|uniref:Predicted acetyltransferase n=1 Tax=Anaerocolumna xylanovorans DSM 12503 TaxID=1121345 RepID=A0A1M7Y4M7_9FIRM|nr:GNAT family N-acetyltransferase [Anaerocolumna xylanovorans]SHO47212.1 Predicted acetyltransferase [Anaerocolumna xylanovorans DSM 12503]
MEYVMFTSLEEAKENGIEKVREDVYSLWQECFGDSDAYTDFYFEWVVPYNRIYTLYKGDKLCSMLHLNPYTLEVKGNEVKSDYIVGVATRKEERRKGYMGLLIERALQSMYEEGKPFTYLMPAAEAIYYPYDFRKVYTQENWVRKMRETALKESGKEKENRLLRLTVPDKNNRRILTEFAENRLRQEYDVYALRSRKYYEKLLIEVSSTNGGIALVFKKDKLIGYAAYMKDDGLQLSECIYDLAYREEVLSKLYHEFSSCLKEKEEGFEPAIMVRIINLKAFFSSLRSKKDISIVIEAKDDRIPDNNGIFRLDISESGCNVTNTEDSPMLRGDIGDLALLFFGKLGEEEIKERIVSGDKNSVFEAISEIQLYRRLFLNEIV